MAGYDPNQPRDEEGKWTEAENAARKAAGLEEKPKKMSKQELANKIYEASTYSSAAFRKNDQQAYSYWQRILQSLIEGMKPRQIYKLVDLADLEFRQAVQARIEKGDIPKG